jgi:hypothetical protein
VDSVPLGGAVAEILRNYATERAVSRFHPGRENSCIRRKPTICLKDVENVERIVCLVRRAHVEENRSITTMNDDRS